LSIVCQSCTNPGARNSVRGPEFAGNAFAVTSRPEERLNGLPKTTIKPLRIQGNWLSPFMEAYLTQRGRCDRGDDAEFRDPPLTVGDAACARPYGLWRSYARTS
jgi:hypothetical protein